MLYFYNNMQPDEEQQYLNYNVLAHAVLSRWRRMRMLCASRMKHCQWKRMRSAEHNSFIENES